MAFWDIGCCGFNSLLPSKCSSCCCMWIELTIWSHRHPVYVPFHRFVYKRRRSKFTRKHGEVKNWTFGKGSRSDSCLQCWGEMGYSAEILISRLYRESRLTSIGGGTDEVMLSVICKLAGLLYLPRKKR